MKKYVSKCHLLAKFQQVSFPRVQIFPRSNNVQSKIHDFQCLYFGAWTTSKRVEFCQVLRFFCEPNHSQINLWSTLSHYKRKIKHLQNELDLIFPQSILGFVKLQTLLVIVVVDVCQYGWVELYVINMFLFCIYLISL